MSKKPENETNYDQALAQLLDLAAKQFEIFLSLKSGDMALKSRQPAIGIKDRFIEQSASSCVEMTLAKAFLFNAARAYRIVEHGADQIAISRDDRKQFMNSLRPIISVRNVNEHAYDPSAGSRGKESRPAVHEHADFGSAGDELSLFISGPETILMGPINLADVNKTIQRMRDDVRIGLRKGQKP